MRVVFFGSPPEAVPALDAAMGIAEVSAVVTRRDRPRGRSGRPMPPPLKIAALERGLDVVQPAELTELSSLLEQADAAVVVAYGRIVPGPLLGLPKAGFVNVHFSVLPRWRGASPVARAILAGDAETGVTLMQMDEGLDTGPVLATRSVAIEPEETAGELTGRLAALGAEMIDAELPPIVAGEVTAEAQDEAAATAAGRIKVEEAFVDPARHGVSAVRRAIRAFAPRPGAWGVVEGDRIKLWRASDAGDAPEVAPGVSEAHGDRVLLGAADGTVELVEVQPAGRSRMTAAAWMNGRRGRPATFGVA